MSTSPEAPALIQYACERCKTRFVLPPSSRKLSIPGKVRAFSMGIGRALSNHEGLGAAYDTTRRQLLSKMDDEAYQSFVQSFRFCHECRQFVCNECWSTSRRSCLTCVAKSMTGTVRPRPPFAPTGPEIPRPIVSSVVPVRKGRLRRDLALVALALAIILVSLEAGILLVGLMPGTGQPAAAGSPTATAQVTAPPTENPGDTESASQSPASTPSASPSTTASASPSATATPTPTPTIRRTAAPTPTAVPTPSPVPDPVDPAITCSGNNGNVPPYTLSCSITNGGSFLPGDTFAWFLDGGAAGSGASASWTINDTDQHSVQVRVTRGAKTAWSNTVYYPA
jgi:hypothetical protein